jgi:hypothetical protein
VRRSKAVRKLEDRKDSADQEDKEKHLNIKKQHMLQTQSGGARHPNYQKKRELFVHSLKLPRDRLWTLSFGSFCA